MELVEGRTIVSAFFLRGTESGHVECEEEKLWKK